MARPLSYDHKQLHHKHTISSVCCTHITVSQVAMTSNIGNPWSRWSQRILPVWSTYKAEVEPWKWSGLELSKSRVSEIQRSWSMHRELGFWAQPWPVSSSLIWLLHLAATITWVECSYEPLSLSFLFYKMCLNHKAWCPGLLGRGRKTTQVGILLKICVLELECYIRATYRMSSRTSQQIGKW